jgi:hypothetical protein
VFHGFSTAVSHWIDQWLILQRKINIGSHSDDVTRDSGRNGKGNGITLWSCRPKFVGMDQFFESIGKVQAIREFRERCWKSANISGLDAYSMQKSMASI